MAYPPERIICLTEETVETLYLLGQDHRIVGVTGYAVRPARVRREKPRVGAFTSADVPKILGLKPDLVLTFSDLQADIAADLIRAGIIVHAFNQRSVAQILAMIRMLGALTGCAARADALADGYAARLDALRGEPRSNRPRVYFEEWDEPPIAGIAWVSELIEIAGGEDVFAPLRAEQGARARILDPQQVIDAAPDVILASWCGKKVRPEKIAARPGWATIPAVANGRITEIKSPLILQPGPAALTVGLDAILTALWAPSRSQAMILPQALQDFLSRGGPTLWIIAALSVLTLALVLWKVWRLARLGAWSGAATRTALAEWEAGNADTALATVAGRASLRARLAQRAMTARLDAALSDPQAREETARFARADLNEARSGLRALELISTIAPLLGLLGTVLGMIGAFQALQEAGSRADPAALAGGIWEALLTTAAGMSVAIPAGVALVWFESLCDRLQADMEDTATRVFTRGPKGDA